MPCWKNSSIFGDAPRVPLDREQRAQFRAKLLLNRRPGRLTIAAAQIGRILVDKLGPEGRLDPSIATLATLACVSQSTVKRALAQLKTFGFLDWARRLIRNETAARLGVVTLSGAGRRGAWRRRGLFRVGHRPAPASLPIGSSPTMLRPPILRQSPAESTNLL